jgi:hypothetical protein
LKLLLVLSFRDTWIRFPKKRGIGKIRNCLKFEEFFEDLFCGRGRVGGN